MYDKSGYQSVSLDRRFIKDIEKAISATGHHYNSVAEFVRHACIERIEKIHNIYNGKRKNG